MTPMVLYPTSVEYAYITVEADDILTDLTGVEVCFLGYDESPDDETVWYEGEWLGDEAATRDFRILLAGPTVNPVPEGAVELSNTRRVNVVFYRLSDNPEVIIRPGGTVEIDR